MKSKLYLFLLTALLALTLVSAQQYTLSTTSLTLDKSTNSTYFTITNTNTSSAITVNLGSFGVINDSNGHSLSISTQPEAGVIIIPANSSQRINVSYSGSASNMAFGTFSSNANVSDGQTTSTITLNFRSTYCSMGEKNTGKLDIDADYEVKKGFGEDDEWYPLDQIEVTVNVDNIGNEDLEDLVLSWCLYDKEDKTCVLEDEADTFDLDEDDNTDLVFTIDLDADELTVKNEDYELIIKVYGDSSDYKEKDLCVEQNVDSVTITMEKDFVVLNSLNFPDSIPCGEIADISGKAWNIGTKDQSGVYFTLYNKDLNILNQKVEVGDIDSFESKSFNTQIKIPENLLAKNYIIYYSVYDDNDDAYESNDKTSSGSFQLSLENCQKPTASITAELSSETPRAVIGGQVIVQATVKNTGTSQSSYTLDVAGVSQWATVAEIDPKTFTLNAGESRTVSIYLDVNADAEIGNKEFTIRTAQSGLISEQKVQLTLEKGFSSTALVDHFKQYWLFYVLSLVILILIIAIIIVLRSIVRKR